MMATFGYSYLLFKNLEHDMSVGRGGNFKQQEKIIIVL